MISKTSKFPVLKIDTSIDECLNDSFWYRPITGKVSLCKTIFRAREREHHVSLKVPKYIFQL